MFPATVSSVSLGANCGVTSPIKEAMIGLTRESMQVIACRYRGYLSVRVEAEGVSAFGCLVGLTGERSGTRFDLR